VAFTKADPLRPADLAVVRGGKPLQLTRLNEELFAGKTLGRVEPLAVRAPTARRCPPGW
jgi:hypothetical protein